MATPITQEKRFDEYASLCDAIQRKDKGAARQHILNNVPVNPTTREPSNTPLHWAILNFSDTEIVKMLLDKGADITPRNQSGETLLYLAVISNKLNVIELLLSKNDHTGDDFSILIAKATEIGNLKMVETLVEHEIQTNRPINLDIAVNIATQSGYAHILQFLLTYHKAENTDKRIPKSLIINKGVRYKKCIDLFLQHGYTIDPEDKNDFNVIYKAVENGYFVMVEKFLKLGVDVDKINSETGFTLLHLACILDNVDIVELLIEYKPNMSLRTSEKVRDHLKAAGPKVELFVGKTALSLAISNLNILIIELLLANGADINNDSDLLKCALNTRSVAIVEILLMYEADLNKVDHLGITPLHYCITSNLQELETEAINASRNDSDGEGYIYYESDPDDSSNSEDENNYSNDSNFTTNSNKEKIENRNNMAKIVELLLSRGANVNAQTYKGKLTPLLCAVQVNSTEIIDVILKYNADVTLADSREHSPLLIACVRKNEELVDKLLKNNANVDCVDLEQSTPLHWACRIQALKIVQNLLNHQANVLAKDKLNRTSFHFLFESALYIPKIPYLRSAHLNQLEEVCKRFIELNADINAVDSEGKTPLFYACYHGSKETVQILLRYGADLNSRDIDGKTLLHAASHGFQQFDIINTLLENKVDASIVDKNGNTILHAALTSSCETDTLMILDRVNVSIINMKNKKGKTALHIATKIQSKKYVQDLLNQGADINITNADNKTALHIAINSIVSAQKNLEEARTDNDDFLIELHQDEFNIYEHTIKILQRHAIKLETARLYVRSEILEIVHDGQLNNFENISADVINFEQQCEEEIQMLKEENVGSTNFYNLLTYDFDCLSKFERNREIPEVLQSDKYDQKFPLYINIIKSRFKEALARKQLLNIVHTYDIYSIIDGLPHICVDKILQYLNTEDLKILISIMTGK